MIRTKETLVKDIQFSNWDFIQILAKFVAPYKGRFFFATAVRLLSDLVWLYPTYALAEVVNFFTKYTFGDPLTRIWWLIGIWIVVIMIHIGGRYVARLVGYTLADRAELDAYLEASRHMYALDMSWHTKLNSGNKVKKIQKGSESISEVVRIWISVLIEVAVNTVGMIFILSRFDWVIGVVLVVFMGIYFVVSRWFILRGSAAAHVMNVAQEDFSGLSYETINNIRSAKVMSMLDILFTKLTNEAKRLYEKTRNKVYWFQTGNAVQNSVGHGFRIGLVIFIIVGIAQGKYEVGFLVLFYGYFNKIWESVLELADVTQSIVIAKYGAARMVEVLNEPVTIDSEDKKEAFNSDWQKIEVRNLTFAYGDDEVLQNIAFTITRGERIGIMGLSGAGKSTLFKILLKEYENYGGDVLIDGVPLRDISKKDYFNHVAVVLQDTEVFNFTIKDNITISNYDKKDDHKLFTKAVTIAHIDELINRLPNHEETFIGEKGVKLSGGEKQRLGLARAVFKEPQILFLDEATSHLDVESEEKIQDSLHQFFQSITAVVIAHRLTTIKEMDRILVMEGGKIIEEGSFESLYNKNGRFRELWDKQKL